MSIIAYTGLPGSGKSYDVVANQILLALKAGRKVVTNIPLVMEELRQVVPEAGDLVIDFPTVAVQSDPALVDDYVRPGYVVVLDEVWRLFPAGLKAHQVPEQFRKMIAEHRHMRDAKGNTLQIVLVTQNLAQIGKFARDQIETTYHHTNLSTTTGVSKAYRIDIYIGAVDGLKASAQSRERSIHGRFDPAIFKLYKSHTLSEEGAEGVNEKPMDTRNSMWRQPMIYVGLAFVVVALAWGIPTTRKAFHPEESLPAVANKKGSSDLAQGFSGTTSTVRRAMEGPYASSREGGWRVLGMIRKESGAGRVAITDGRVTAFLDLERNCYVDLDLGPVCRWEGGEITMYSEQRYASPAPEPAPVVGPAPSAGGERSDPPADASAEVESRLEG